MSPNTVAWLLETSLGITDDRAALAVSTIRTSIERVGRPRHPPVQELAITAG